jgi:hypothetical protein
LGSIETVKMQAHVDLLPDDRASGDVTASISGGTLLWGDFRFAASSEIRAAVQPLAAPNESRVTALVRLARVEMKGGPGAPKRWDARIPRVSLDGAFDRIGDRFDGTVDVTAKRMRAAIGKVSMQTDLSAHVHLMPTDVPARAGTVSGLVNLTKATIWNDRRRIEGWWAKIGVSPTRVVVGENLGLDGRVSARFKDGLPGLLALSEADQIPGFLPAALPLHGLVGTVRVRKRCQLTDLVFSQFEGGPLFASGRVQNAAGNTRGAVLVRMGEGGVISAGISFGEGGDGVSFLVGDDWLRSRMAGFDEEATSASERPCPPVPKSECGAT